VWIYHCSDVYIAESAGFVDLLEWWNDYPHGLFLKNLASNVVSLWGQGKGSHDLLLLFANGQLKQVAKSAFGQNDFPRGYDPLSPTQPSLLTSTTFNTPRDVVVLDSGAIYVAANTKVFSVTWNGVTTAAYTFSGGARPVALTGEDRLYVALETGALYSTFPQTTALRAIGNVDNTLPILDMHVDQNKVLYVLQGCTVGAGTSCDKFKITRLLPNSNGQYSLSRSTILADQNSGWLSNPRALYAHNSANGGKAFITLFVVDSTPAIGKVYFLELV